MALLLQNLLGGGCGRIRRGGNQKDQQGFPGSASWGITPVHKLVRRRPAKRSMTARMANVLPGASGALWRTLRLERLKGRHDPWPSVMRNVAMLQQQLTDQVAINAA